MGIVESYLDNGRCFLEASDGSLYLDHVMMSSESGFFARFVNAIPTPNQLMQFTLG